MPKFSKTQPRPPQAVTRTVGSAVTHEGGQGYEKDPKTALYTLGVTNMVAEPTFYESAEGRDDRYRSLAEQVTGTEPDWMQGFIPWLRETANMRTAPLVAALEYARAGGPNARSVISSALCRADEPAEALGYWLHCYGRKIPMAVKRGIADGAVRLYTEFAAIKYDGSSRGVRMGDVIELTHPSPDTPAQSALFKYLLDRRHGHFGTGGDAAYALTNAGLTKLATAYTMETVDKGYRRQFLRDNGYNHLSDAGFTWERLSGWLPGGMDAEAWEAIIPRMGYMALLRNLRNFEQAKVDKKVLQAVGDKLADPDEVAKSRQFPYRFWSAYKNSGTMFFGPALEQALEHSLQNVPLFPGRTLVMVDTSGSMGAPVSARSSVLMYEIAALFGVAVAHSSKVDFAMYADTDRALNLPTSVLRGIELVQNNIGAVGYGTNTWPSTMSQYNGHDRIVVFTDGQDHPDRARTQLPDVPIYVWDLSGYHTTNVDLQKRNRYLFGGFSDAAFRLINLLEVGDDVGWPWEH